MNRRGFSLLELIIVVSILSILASIALPRFTQTIQKANEAATRGRLLASRSALSIYYAELEGFYPSDLTPLTEPGSRYLSRFGPVFTAAHGNNSNITYTSAFDSVDNGGWAYVNNMTDTDWGKIWVQCTHIDTRGKAWNQY